MTPSGVAGLDFLDEADTVNALVPRLKQRGAETIDAPAPQGGFQNPPPPSAGRVLSVDLCRDTSGPEITDIVAGSTPKSTSWSARIRTRRTSARSTDRLVTSASSFGRVITEIKLTIDRRTNDVVSATADNNIVTQDVPKDARATAILAARRSRIRSANQVVGFDLRDLTRNATPAGESVLGDIIADAQARATKPSDFGSSVVAFMNPGGIRSDLIYTRTDEATQDGLRGTCSMQPFGNTVTVKTCTGAQIDASPRAAGLAGPLCDAPGGRSHPPGIGKASRTPRSGRRLRTDRRSMRHRSRSMASRSANTPYRVTMNSFLADGDGFTVFRQCTNQLGGEVDLDAAVRYFEDNSPISPTAANRITRLPVERVAVGAAPAATTDSAR